MNTISNSGQRRSALSVISAALFSVLLIAGIWAYASETSYAATSVKTNIPAFKVTLNNNEISNDYSQYPLIVYKDITYFPMTYFDCRFLGIETMWINHEQGLFINTTGVKGAYTPYGQVTRNNRNNTATVVDTPVTINGKSINNSQEPYPLLLFRDITYFPMTWRFCVDEFQWNYHFDQNSGLVISSTATPIISYSELPEKSKKENHTLEVTTDGQFVYYEDTRGQIVQMPLSAISNGNAAKHSNGKIVYQLPRSSNEEYCLPAYQEQNNKLYLTYHTGGATMGTQQIFQLTAQGLVDLSAGNNNYFDYDTVAFKYWIGAAPSANNLTMRRSGSNAWQNIGDGRYIYGWNYYKTANQQGGSPTDCLYYDGGNYVYTLGYDLSGGVNCLTGIYCINIQDNTTTRIVPETQEVTDFKVANQKLIYHVNKVFYEYDLNTRTTRVYANVTNAAASASPVIDSFTSFEIVNGSIFAVASTPAGNQSYQLLYMVTGSSQLLRINDANWISAVAKKTDRTTGTEYLAVSCINRIEAPYRLMILDGSGSLLLKNNDVTHIRNICVIDGQVLYFNKNNDRLCAAKL